MGKELPEPERVAAVIVDAALAVHRGFGPGLLESVYEKALAAELRRRRLKVARQHVVPFEFAGERYPQGLRVDLLVQELVVVEIKAARRLVPVNFRQTLSYLRLLDLPIGLLINFGGATLKDGGIHRLLNNYRPVLDFRSP